MVDFAVLPPSCQPAPQISALHAYILVTIGNDARMQLDANIALALIYLMNTIASNVEVWERAVHIHWLNAAIVRRNTLQQAQSARMFNVIAGVQIRNREPLPRWM